jgi:TonB family protein
MIVSTGKVAATAALGFVIGLSTWFAHAAAGGSGPSGGHMVYLRGPGDPDCAGERERARAKGDPAGIFLTEFRCRVHAGWKCPAACKGDELLVTHVAVKVTGKGEVADGQVVRNAESRSFDDDCLRAVRAGSPYPAPPPALLDRAGAAPLKIEFVCDCAEKPRR